MFGLAKERGAFYDWGGDCISLGRKGEIVRPWSQRKKENKKVMGGKKFGKN